MFKGKKIPHIKAPTQRLLSGQPLIIENRTTEKKYKLNYDKNIFIFFINKTVLNLIFLQYDGRIYRLPKLLKEYTKTTDINTQFIELLNNPVIIINCNITNIILEIIYLTHLLYNIDF